MKNPFSSELAKKNSCYLLPKENDLETLIHTQKDIKVNDRHQFIHKQLRTLITSREFPCIGAKAAFNNGTYRIGVYNSMTDDESPLGLCYDLYEFVNDQINMKGNFTTFIATFENTIINSEDHFEELMWSVLQKMHNEDRKYHDWDHLVSSDPDDPGFTISFAGRAYFLVGMHPASSRFSRKFAYPTIVFNAQYQFEKLKEEGRFENMKKVIREKDAKINNGQINPNLGDLYEVSAAGQFGTKAKPEGWKCPFHH
jgi:FPC/CPF motif-containing protein YcgG